MLLWVALGAAVGAPLRYLVDRWLNVGRTFPWGTFAVNIAGSFLLATLLGLHVGQPVSQTLGVGFCGALTTYSTFGFEVLREGRTRLRVGVSYALASVTIGLLAAYAGVEFGRLLAP
ncbi:MAG: fluoride exporter [Mycobacterium sp.]|jgi:CrcB protein|nr:fluoride exporter [Mycobacterium sp.]